MCCNGDDEGGGDDCKGDKVEDSRVTEETRGGDEVGGGGGGGSCGEWIDTWDREVNVHPIFDCRASRIFSKSDVRLCTWRLTCRGVFSTRTRSFKS